MAIKVGDRVEWEKLDIVDWENASLRVGVLVGEEGAQEASLTLMYRSEEGKRYLQAIRTIWDIFGTMLDVSHQEHSSPWHGPKFRERPRWDKFWFKVVARIGPVPVSELKKL